jgi:hypothetical protein
LFPKENIWKADLSLVGHKTFLKNVVGGALLKKDKKCVLRVVVNGSSYTKQDTTYCGMFEIKFLLSESEIKQSAVRSLLK